MNKMVVKFDIIFSKKDNKNEEKTRQKVSKI